MKIGIMQPYFFPYLGYYQHINAVDKFIMLDDVNFIKKGWIHRNNLLLQGEPKQFNLSISKSSQNSLINELSLNEEVDWRQKIVTTLEHAYRKAQYYNEIMDLLKNIIFNDEVNLSSYLYHTIKGICEYLEIETVLIPTSSVYEKGELRGEDRIISICKEEKCSRYINPSGGIELYKRDHFSSQGIELEFIKMNEIEYPQLSTKFTASLSIIDVLMNNSLEEIKRLINEYSLFNNE